MFILFIVIYNSVDIGKIAQFCMFIKAIDKNFDVDPLRIEINAKEQNISAK